MNIIYLFICLKPGGPENTGRAHTRARVHTHTLDAVTMSNQWNTPWNAKNTEASGKTLGVAPL